MMSTFRFSVILQGYHGMVGELASAGPLGLHAALLGAALRVYV